MSESHAPTPPDLAALPAEQRDSAWFKHYFQGYDAPQLTVRAVVTGGVLGMLMSVSKEVPIGVRLFTRKGVSFTGSMLGMGIEPSTLLIGAGMIVGLRVSVSMLVGSLVNYCVLTPYVLSLPDWVESGRQYWGELEVVMGNQGAIPLVRVTRWSLWLGSALMVTAGLTSFALGWRTIVRALLGSRSRGLALATGHDPVAELEVPLSWMFLGGVPVTLGLVLLGWLAFAVAPWLGLVSIVLSFALALVACRATGETDTTPIGAMGKLTQLVYAVIAPSSTTTNLLSAGVTAGAAGSAADLLTDLKSGVPSAMGLGLAFVVPFANSFAFFVGAVLAELWRRFHRASAERYVVPIASGVVAGESFAAALHAMAMNLGWR